jgi:hypothetical protein
MDVPHLSESLSLESKRRDLSRARASSPRRNIDAGKQMTDLEEGGNREG